MNPYNNQGNQDTRSGFGAGLSVLGAENPNVVALCADLTGSLNGMPLKPITLNAFFK